jgi:HlyD family secretion protein
MMASRGTRAAHTRRRQILWGLAGAAVVVLVALALRPTPVAVETAAVTRGVLEVTVDAEGMTRVRERYVITTPVAGRLARIDLRAGDSVRRGTIIARLTPVPLGPQAREQARAAATAAESRLDEARARSVQAAEVLAQARRTLERTTRLVDSGGLSQAVLDAARLDLAVAEREHEAATSRVAAATGELTAARAALMNVDPTVRGEGGVVELRSPVTGVVLRIPDASERIVGPGTPVADVGDVTDLEVVVDILSSDAPRIAPGMEMQLDGWGGTSPVQATVERVEPSAFTRISALGVEEQRVNVIGRLPGDAAGMGDGFRIEARIVVWSARDALQVPGSALFRHGDGWAAFSVRDGRAVLQPVDVGNRGAVEVEVRGGLVEGDLVVDFPSDRLADGTRVRPAPPARGMR